MNFSLSINCEINPWLSKCHKTKLFSIRCNPSICFQWFCRHVGRTIILTLYSESKLGYYSIDSMHTPFITIFPFSNHRSALQSIPNSRFFSFVKCMHRWMLVQTVRGSKFHVLCPFIMILQYIFDNEKHVENIFQFWYKTRLAKQYGFSRNRVIAFCETLVLIG